MNVELPETLVIIELIVYKSNGFAIIDELHTYVGKKNKIWLWTVVNKAKSGIIVWVIGDRSAETFKPLWQIVKGWQCFFYVTDGYVVYPQFIEDADHIVNKSIGSISRGSREK